MALHSQPLRFKEKVLQASSSDSQNILARRNNAIKGSCVPQFNEYFSLTFMVTLLFILEQFYN